MTSVLGFLGFTAGGRIGCLTGLLGCVKVLEEWVVSGDWLDPGKARAECRASNDKLNCRTGELASSDWLARFRDCTVGMVSCDWLKM